MSSNIFGVGGGLQIPYLVDSTLQDVEFFTFLVWMLDLVLTSGSSLHVLFKKLITHVKTFSTFTWHYNLMAV